MGIICSNRGSWITRGKIVIAKVIIVNPIIEIIKVLKNKGFNF